MVVAADPATDLGVFCRCRYPSQGVAYWSEAKVRALTPQEEDEAVEHARALHARSARIGAADTRTITGAKQEAALSRDIVGARGEMAYGIFFGEPWPKTLDLGDPDYPPDIEIRTINSRRGTSLILRERDMKEPKVGRRYVLLKDISYAGGLANKHVAEHGFRFGGWGIPRDYAHIEPSTRGTGLPARFIDYPLLHRMPLHKPQAPLKVEPVTDRQIAYVKGLTRQ